MATEKKIKLPNIDVRSDEVQEILGIIPHWIIRTGILLIVSIIVIVLIGSWFFKYPDIIPANVIVSTEYPPSPVVARVNGKIDHLFIKNNQLVKKNDLLLVIESGSIYQDVEELEDLLSDIAIIVTENDSSYFDSIDFRQDINLGKLQSFYAGMQKSYSDYNYFIMNNLYSSNIASKETEIFDHQILYQRQFKQRDIKEEELELGKIQLDRIQSLKDTGAKTVFEFEQEQTKYLQKQYEFETARTVLSDTKIKITRLKQELEDLKYNYKEEKLGLRIALSEAHDILIAELSDWKMKYLLKSPADGIVSFTDFWSEKLEVIEGMTVLSIVPADSSRIIGKAQLTVKGAGKVKIDQEVNIKLDNYPYMEYGMVKAFVKTISIMPEKEFYSVELEIPDGLRTNYNRNLEFTQSLQGTAEIITEDIRLLVRILNPLKSLFKKQL